MTAIDSQIAAIATEFTNQLTRLRTRASRSNSYQSDTIELQLQISSDGPNFRLEYRGPCGTVYAASLGNLIAEVWRREGFQDQEQGQIQAASLALVGLPAPAPAANPDPISGSDTPF